MLLRCLNGLGHEFLEAAMVYQDCEGVPEKVLAPFLNGGGNSG